jgi:hypothetical protein
MRRIRLLSKADAGWRLRLLTAGFVIAAAMSSVAAVNPQLASADVLAAHPAEAPSGASTKPLAAVRPGSVQAQAMQRGVEAKLAARQAASIAPRGSRAEAGAIPVLRTKAASSQAGPNQPEMVKAAAAESQHPAAQVTRSASPGRPLATAAAAGTPDTGLDAMFNNYGNNAGCADWSGGDATNGVNLGGGTVAWFFSDSYLGSPAARKTLFYRSTLRNSIVIQNGTSLRTITGGNTCQERNTSLSFWDRYAKTPAPAPDASSGGFYWTGDQMVVGSNVVKFYYHGTPGKFPFAIDSSAVATIPVSALESDKTMNITPLQFTNLCTDSADGSTVIWGSALLNWQGNVYVYGWSTTNSKLLYLAKTTAANLTDPSTWQTFDGLDSSGNPIWSGCGDGNQLVPLPITLGSGLSVATIPGSSSLWLIQEDPGNGLVNGPITAHPAAEPWLFGNQEDVLYYPPEESHSYPYYYLTYEARLQPAFASASQVVISYNVNTTAVDTGCVSANNHDASIYRPRFIDVPTSAFSTASLTAEAASSGTGLPAPSYGIQDDGPAAPSPAPAVNQTGTVLDSAAGTGPSIDGVTDWYDQWGSLAGGCPGYQAPATLSVSPSTPDGEATLTWPTVGTDVWFWGYQADQTAGTDFAKTWGGLWAEPASSTATTVSNTVAPVTSTQTNGHTYAWYIVPFGAGGGPIGPVGTSPTVSEAMTIQPPATPYDLGGSSGPAESQFNLGWTDPNYPSSAVYYWVFQWDITAGQTEQEALAGSGGPGCGVGYETCAGAFPDALPPGTKSDDIQGWTPDNSVILTPDHMYGFVLETENLAGWSIPSIPASVTPTPVCWAGDLSAGGGSQFQFLGGPIVYMYFGLESAYFSAGGDVLSLTDLGTNQTQKIALIPSPAEEVVQWEIGADPPVTWDFNWALYSNHDVYGTATSESC